MASVLKPVSLSIDIEAARAEIPQALAQRLSSKTSPPPSPNSKGSPPASPSKEQRYNHAVKLHEAHLAAVKERAERDLQRLDAARATRARGARALAMCLKLLRLDM